jgi:hypothetical protein
VANIIEKDREQRVTVPSTSRIFAVLKNKTNKFSSKDDLLAVFKIISLPLLRVGLLLFLV